jgi:hypothetical protein
MPSNETVLYKHKEENIETVLVKEEDFMTGEVTYCVDTYRLRTDETGQESKEYLNNSGTEENREMAIQYYLWDLDCFQNGADDAEARKEITL